MVELRAEGVISYNFRRCEGLLRHPALVRAGGVALVFGGIFTILSACLLLREALSGYSTYAPAGTSLALIGVSTSLAALFVPPGLAGIYALASGVSPRIKKLAGAGLLASAPLGIVFGFVVLQQTLWPPDPFGSPYDGSSPSREAFHAVVMLFYYLGPVGIILLGVAALRVRGLGYFACLPLILGVMLTPLPDVVIPYLLRPDSPGYNVVFVDGAPVVKEYLFDSVIPFMPDLIAGVCCTSLGIVLFGAREREVRTAARERRLAEQVNLEAARELYKRAWVGGDYSVLHDLVLSDVVDEYHGYVGIRDFERNVTGLRRSFPDLKFEVESQTAGDDTVTTRWNLTGTDRGGILYYPPTGRRVSVSGVFTDRFEGGKLVEHRGESDAREVLAKLREEHELR